MEKIPAVIERSLTADGITGFRLLFVRLPSGLRLLEGLFALPLPGELFDPPEGLERGGDPSDPLPCPGLLKTRPPERPAEIILLLSCGIFPGLDRFGAAKIVERFGERTLSVIDESPEKLALTPGLSEDSRERIIEGRQGFLRERELALFLLENYRLGPLFASQLLQSLGPQAKSRVEKDPSLLLESPLLRSRESLVALALKTPNPPAALLSALVLAEEREGRSFVERRRLMWRAAELLARAEAGKGPGSPPESPPDAPVETAPGPLPGAASRAAAKETREKLGAVLGALSLGSKISPLQGSFPEEDYVQSARVGDLERRAARALLNIRKSGRRIPPEGIKAALRSLERAPGLSERDRWLIGLTLERKVLLIDSGPGSQSTLAAELARGFHRSIGLAAEICSPEAGASGEPLPAEAGGLKSLPALLEYSPISRAPARGSLNPLETDLLVILDAHLLELESLVRLLSALPATCGLVIAGDRFLPENSRPGEVFENMLRSGLFPALRLTESPGEAASPGLRSLLALRRGELPPGAGNGDPDFHFVSGGREELLEKALELILETYPKRLGLPPEEAALLICPAKEGPLGSASLNKIISARHRELFFKGAPRPAGLGGPRPEAHARVTLGEGWEYSPGQRVTLLRDREDLALFAGTSLLLTAVNPDLLEAEGIRGEKSLRLGRGELFDFAPSWALSLEDCRRVRAPAAIFLADPENMNGVDRNTLALALSRGRNRAALLGARAATARALSRERARDSRRGSLEIILREEGAAG
ncbi:MAG: hypothetical protein LBR53_09110 [Deltaproteobacteria bacterium]|jgi:exodeoxyribonuclease V alpha subunit|nr:hypothetical protein [Deltaproteobacteria bacterium]